MGVQQLTFSIDAIKASLTAMCEVSKLEYLDEFVFAIPIRKTRLTSQDEEQDPLGIL